MIFEAQGKKADGLSYSVASALRIATLEAFVLEASIGLTDAGTVDLLLDLGGDVD